MSLPSKVNSEMQGEDWKEGEKRKKNVHPKILYVQLSLLAPSPAMDTELEKTHLTANPEVIPAEVRANPLLLLPPS